MKKRIAVILSLILVLVISCVSFGYAEGLALVGTTPEDGATGKHPQNMAVKLKFNESMMDDAAILKNSSKLAVLDPDGNHIPFTVTYNEKKTPNELWLVLTDTLQSTTTYTVKALPGITAASGNTLDEGFEFSFTTRNTTTDSTISMVLMCVMMVIMFITSSKAMKKQAAEQEARIKEAQEASLNPYKIAKEKGISVEEANILVAKEKAKIEKKAAKLELERAKREKAKAEEIAAIEAELRAAEEAARKADNYRVKAPHSIKTVGGVVPKSVIKANKAKRDAAAKAAKKASKK